MLTFSTLTAEAADYPRMLDLYLSAFPAEERRDVSDLVRLMCGEPRFHVLAAYDEAGFAGFITYWDFSAFRYVEHFAISDACRGKGYGGAVIEHVKSATDLPILLEVEPPVTEQAVRRIRFYETTALPRGRRRACPASDDHTVGVARSRDRFHGGNIASGGVWCAVIVNKR